jgi:hypothetical protein
MLLLDRISTSRALRFVKQSIYFCEPHLVKYLKWNQLVLSSKGISPRLRQLKMAQNASFEMTEAGPGFYDPLLSRLINTRQMQC